MTQREIQENLIRTVRDMLLTSCEKMGAQSIEHCWTRHDGTEVKLILAIHRLVRRKKSRRMSCTPMRELLSRNLA